MACETIAQTSVDRTVEGHAGTSDTDRLAAVAKEIRASGTTALVVEADVTQRSEADGAVQSVVDEFGRLDVLVNNAGVMLLGPILQAPVEEWERMVQLNVLGLLYCAKAALPHPLEAAEREPRMTSALVFVSSVAGRHLRLGCGVYNATNRLS